MHVIDASDVVASESKHGTWAYLVYRIDDIINNKQK